jgi:hypothetical protein
MVLLNTIFLLSLYKKFRIFVKGYNFLLSWGDFNLIRNNKKRNQGQGDPKLMLLFNSFIGDLQLREIFISGVKKGTPS